MTTLDYGTLTALREHHPAWRLLVSPHAALVASFLHCMFITENKRGIHEAELTETLKEELLKLREQFGEDDYPKSATEYLNDWCASDKGWLRKYYKPGTDEAQFDLTPATEKAIGWLASLTERPFVGTESRLRTLFTLLEQINTGTETDPAKRLADLYRKRDEIDDEITRIQVGEVPLLDDIAIKERFLQFQQLARELLSDFRQVEHNFRQLDRNIREKIVQWDGSKGALLDEIFGETDSIIHSDQGQSFQAFWEFLKSDRRQKELSDRLEQILSLPSILELAPEPRTRRIYHDCLEASGHIQHTVAQLSQQLRHFLDNRVFAENRRILELLRHIEGHAIALRDAPPKGSLISIDAVNADIALPLERPLFTSKDKPHLQERALQAGPIDDIDLSHLFEQSVVDKNRLHQILYRALRKQPQINLRTLLDTHPLQQGLAELVTWLELAHPGVSDDYQVTIDETIQECIRWTAQGMLRQVYMPRVIFVR